MKAAELAAEEEQIRVTSMMAGLYFSSVDMAQLLELSDNELTRLARSAVLVRRRDPVDNRGYVYPIWENVRRYVLRVRARRGRPTWSSWRKRAGTQRAARQRLELAVVGALVAESYHSGCMPKSDLHAPTVYNWNQQFYRGCAGFAYTTFDNIYYRSGWRP